MASGQGKAVGVRRIKGNFAKTVAHFANRALARRSERILVLATAAAIVFCGLSGPFGTFVLPLGQRLAFWSVLIILNALLWGSWFRLRLRENRGWKRVAGEGAVLFFLPIPAEIEGIGAFVGAPISVHWPAIWMYTSALAAILFALLLLVMSAARERKATKGILFREGFGDGKRLATVRAEDHFCRIVDLDGREKLVYARFADIEGEVADLDGMVVRRGCWIAAGAVSGIDRQDRKWRIRLADGTSIAVPEGKVAVLRDAGWI